MKWIFKCIFWRQWRLVTKLFRRLEIYVNVRLRFFAQVTCEKKTNVRKLNGLGLVFHLMYINKPDDRHYRNLAFFFLSNTNSKKWCLLLDTQWISHLVICWVDSVCSRPQIEVNRIRGCLRHAVTPRIGSFEPDASGDNWFFCISRTVILHHVKKSDRMKLWKVAGRGFRVPSVYFGY